jgi:hypothetical protein
MSNVHTLSDHAQVKESFTLAITAATTNGTVIDAQGYENALAIFNSAPSGGGTTSDCKLQEGDQANLSDAADVTGGAFAQVTTAGGKKVETMNIDLSRRKRYLRLVHTGAGGAAAGQACGILVLFNARNNPPAQDVTPKTV